VTAAPAVGTTATAQWRAIGVDVHLVVTEPHLLAAARSLLEAELADLDLACSRFRPDSELVRLDATAGGGTAVAVSPLLAEAIGVALDAAEATQGAVDPTLGQVLSDLGYDRTFTTVAADGPARRIRVRIADPAGWRQVALDREAGTVRLPAGIRLDLGATAKALGADRAAARIHAELGTGVLVGLGGDVAMAGPAPDGGWPVRVQDSPGPLDGPAPGPRQTVALLSGGLATSGIAARRWTRGGAELHHLLDPATGMPARTPWRTVTVAAPTCVRANTVTTATLVRGDDGLAWLVATGLPARLVAQDGTVTRVGGWPDPS
jgi:thiamine biosynthesis lipoprotein